MLLTLQRGTAAILAAATAFEISDLSFMHYIILNYDAAVLPMTAAHILTISAVFTMRKRSR